MNWFIVHSLKCHHQNCNYKLCYLFFYSYFTSSLLSEVKKKTKGKNWAKSLPFLKVEEKKQLADKLNLISSVSWLIDWKGYHFCTMQPATFCCDGNSHQSNYLLFSQKKSASKARRDPAQWNMTLLRYRWLPVNCTLHLRHRRPSKTVAQTRINKQANAQNAASLSVMCNYGDIYHFATVGGNDFKFWAISIHRLSETQPLSLPCQSRGRIKCWLQLVSFPLLFL